MDRPTLKSDATVKVLQTGFVGGGRLVCDGTNHFIVRDDWKALKCPPSVHVNECNCNKPRAAAPVVETGELIGKH